MVFPTANCWLGVLHIRLCCYIAPTDLHVDFEALRKRAAATLALLLIDLLELIEAFSKDLLFQIMTLVVRAALVLCFRNFIGVLHGRHPHMLAVGVFGQWRRLWEGSRELSLRLPAGCSFTSVVDWKPSHSLPERCFAHEWILLSYGVPTNYIWVVGAAASSKRVFGIAVASNPFWSRVEQGSAWILQKMVLRNL